MHLKNIFFGVAACFSFSGHAQVVDNTATFTNMDCNTWFRFHYDNDFFTATDDYYTQGLTLEFAHPALKKNPLNQFLIRPPKSTIRYGIRTDHYGYTPSTIRSNEILYGDRPFCSNLSASAFAIATDTLRRRRISTTLVVGIMGPAAGSERMQKAIHRWLDNIPPLGWQHQIRNDLILNYQIDYEQNIWKIGHWVLANVSAGARVGTHTNQIKAGCSLLIGWLNDPFQESAPAEKWSGYFYVRGQPGYKIYEATLQGGLFNRDSPYVLAPGDLTRLTFQGDFGFVLVAGKLYLEYSQSFLTKEFDTGKTHRWGGIRIGVGF
ncbi:MAG: lipid A deacylase LpxR family protein [Saprospiraceae bacterium]|nr:lipid A deacylase LpxR family protein [Saprospiraceae bacterium]